jgi:hypothetical protein
MPMFDAYLTLSDTQSLAGVASTTAYGTYELDFEQAYPDKGAGSPLVVRFIVMTTFTVATYVQFALCFDATTQVPTPSATIVVETAPIAVSTLVQGYSFELKIPDEHLQFMNVAYLTTGTPGAGAITAYVDINTGLRHR